MRKSIKLVSILMIVMVLITTTTPVFARDNAAEVITKVNESIDVKDPTSDHELRAKVGKIIGVLQWIGIVAGVAIIAIFGIKYMMGSLEEKAEYKKTMVPFIVGAVVLMLAPQIAKLIFTIVE